MIAKDLPSGEKVAAAIRHSGLSIYDPIDRNSPLFFDIEILEDHLRTKLRGLDLDFPLRTRAKVQKQAIAGALGYPVPSSFKKTQPRFPAQDLDVYGQKSDNLQIWNEEVAPTRRYAILRLNANSVVEDVRVVTGETLARLDTTGTLTQKYQAKRRAGQTGSRLVTVYDTGNFSRLLSPVGSVPDTVLARMHPTARPVPGQVLTINALYHRLSGMVGKLIVDQGLDQERNRGEALHRLTCQTLGLNGYADLGQFPDVLCQALEVKLQTSPTIDLGLVSPDSSAVAEEIAPTAQHRDARYLVAYGRRLSPTQIEIAEIIVTTGESFFTEFQRFEGKVTNTKIQIPLPSDFFRKPK